MPPWAQMAVVAVAVAVIFDRAKRAGETVSDVVKGAVDAVVEAPGKVVAAIEEAEAARDLYAYEIVCTTPDGSVGKVIWEGEVEPTNEERQQQQLLYNCAEATFSGEPPEPWYAHQEGAKL